MDHSSEHKRGSKNRLTIVSTDLLDNIAVLQQMVKDCQEDIEHSGTETEYLKKRDAERERKLDRLATSVRRSLEEFKANYATLEEKSDRAWGEYVPRELFYQLVVVVCALASETWPNAEDRPFELDEMLAIRDGFEKHGASYVH